MISDEEQLKTLRLSPTSINTFYQCPRRWYYENIEKRKTPDTIPLVRGKVVHNVLENIFDYNYTAGEEFRNSMLNRGRKLLEEEWNKFSEDLHNCEETNMSLQLIYEETEEMIIKFINKFCDNVQMLIRSGKASSEKHGYFLLKPKFRELWIDDLKQINFNNKYKKESVGKELDNPLRVGGFVDSIQKDFDNNLVLVDYKTSNKYQNVLDEGYFRQMAIYAYLWYKQTGELPRFVAINYLKFDESFFILVTPDLIKYAEDAITYVRNSLLNNGLDKQNYYKKTGKLCDYCPFKEECINNG